MKFTAAAFVLAGVAVIAGPAAGSGAGARPSALTEAVASYWTPARRAEAVPRDILVDGRGLSYLRAGDGSLRPYGHRTPYGVTASAPAEAPVPRAKAGGSSAETIKPVVINLNPAAGATIGSSYPFRADVSDASGIRSVSFQLTYPDGRTQSYGATLTSGTSLKGTWGIHFSGFYGGPWSWVVVAKDKANNSFTTAVSVFTVDTGGTGGAGAGSTIVDAPWTGSGGVMTAAGRLIFEMPSNTKKTKWTAYWCSATVTDDDASDNDRSIILTAAHCTYDDVYKAFARRPMFIPDQGATSGLGSDRDCSNDPLGCWVPTRGAVHTNWADRTWDSNIPWDYGYYIVPTTGAHDGAAATSDSLEIAAPPLTQSFEAPGTGLLTHAFGYSGSKDPDFRYCSENLGTINAPHNWWLGSCGLTGGSSGGPWLQPFAASTGIGTIISVNSWGYSNRSGMAGPKFDGTSPQCVKAALLSTESTSGEGLKVNC